MAEDPKSVIPPLLRSRMTARQGSAAHPDADLLAAFSEQRLAEAERNAVLEHLSVCPECREVVSLATPEEVSNVPVPVPWRLFGLGFPQWGALGLSAAAVVAFFVMVRNEAPVSRPATQTVSKVQTPAAPPPPPAAARKEAETPAANGVVPRRMRRESKREDGLLKDKQTIAADEVRAVDALSAKKAPAESGGRKIASANEAVEVTSAAPAVAPQQSQGAPAAASETVTVEAETAGVPAAAPAAQSKPVPQEERAAAATGMHDYAVMNKQVANVKPPNIVARPDGTKFRFQNAALWRADEKGQWQRVMGAWSGAITRLSFSSNEKGELGTSTAETWITVDGGEHWMKK